MNLAKMRAAVSGSGGVVRRTSGVLLLVDTSTDAGPRLLVETSESDGRELYEDLRARAASGSLPSLGALIDVDGTTIALLSGALAMTASTDLGSVEAKPQGSGVYEQPLHTETIHVALQLTDGGAATPDASIADLLDLHTGTVVGGGVSLVTDDTRTPAPGIAGAVAGGAVIGGAVSNPAVRSSLGDPVGDTPPVQPVQAPAEPPAPAEPAPAPEAAPPVAPAAEQVPPPPQPAPAEAVPPAPAPAAAPAPAPAAAEAAPEFESIDLTAEPEAVGEPLPVETPGSTGEADADDAAGSDGAANVAQVLGVRCPVDHHNHPDAQYCSQCGRKMGVNRTVVLVQGPRPPLGLFVAEDGTTIQLSSDVVIGRDPNSHEAVIAGSASGVGLTDDSLGLSRSHAMIVLNDWDVTVRDLESANGTFLRRAGDDGWEQLNPAAAATLRAGDMIKVPGYELQLELFHIAGAPKT